MRNLFDSVRPRGITPIGEKLEELLLDYLGHLDDAKDCGSPAVFKAIKPVNYIVITDGAPSMCLSTSSIQRDVLTMRCYSG